MSNNYFYNDLSGSTFQSNFVPPNFVPPPPLPPPGLFYLPTAPHVPFLDTSDHDFVKKFEYKALSVKPPTKPKAISISQCCDKIQDMLISVNVLKRRVKELINKKNTCPDDNWKEEMEEINHDKKYISNLLSIIKSSYLDILKKSIVKRAAKRSRLRKQRKEMQKEKEDRIKALEERSRKINESLQRTQDLINKTKQEEELKLQADVVLKEVLRKKHNANKFVSKLDALKKLRIARLNTARGRGEDVPGNDTEEFETKMEKLKLLWAQKLSVYKREEKELLASLESGVTGETGAGGEAGARAAWGAALFGAAVAPQADFRGDVPRFVAVRCEWDRYASDTGSSIPVGWVMPSMPSQ